MSEHRAEVPTETVAQEPFTLERAQSGGRGLLRVTCTGCGEVTTQFDKGLGRANIAAWKTRHQHLSAADGGDA